MNTQATIELKHLSIDKMNVRAGDTKPSPAFVASIAAKGVLEPLTVRRNGSGYAITNGGRRFAALHHLAKKGEMANGVKVTPEFPVPVIISEMDDATARDVSLTLNVIRENMHPVDRYEVFKLLIDGGKTPADLKAEYLLSDRQYAQAMVLGRLAPAIRKAWRDGEIDADTAQAFTLEQDQKRQDEIFKRLSKGRYQPDAHDVRVAIAPDDSKTSGFLRYVGVDAYKAADGGLKLDLFADENKEAIPADIKLVAKLAEEKIEKKIEELVEGGWKFVLRREQNDGAWYSWRSTGKDADKSKTGVLLGFDYRGHFEIKYGVQRPGDAKTSSSAKSKKKAKGEKSAPAQAAISQNMQNDLTRHLNGAVQIAVAQDFDLAFPLLLTSLYLSVTEHGDDCLHISGATRLDETDPTTQQPIKGSIEAGKLLDQITKKIPRTFPKALETIADMSAKDQQRLCAVLTGVTIDVTNHEVQRKGLEPKDRDALLDFVQPDIHAGWQATGKSLFNHVPKAFAEEAISDCAPMSTESARIGVMKKAEAAAVAERVVKGKKWLPEPLRMAGYDGPGSKKPAKKSKR